MPRKLSHISSLFAIFAILIYSVGVVRVSAYCADSQHSSAAWNSTVECCTGIAESCCGHTANSNAPDLCINEHCCDVSTDFYLILPFVSETNQTILVLPIVQYIKMLQPLVESCEVCFTSYAQLPTPLLRGTHAALLCVWRV